MPTGRAVRIDLETNGHNLPEARLPSTMRICRESRAETLSRYRIVYPSSAFKFEDENCVSPPFVFDPVTDMVYVSSRGEIPVRIIMQWLDYLEAVLPDALHCIKRLRLLGPHVEERWSNWNLDDSEDGGEELIVQLILRFRGLETLCVLEHEEMDMHWLKSRLQANVKEFVKGKMPEIKETWW